MQLKATPSSLDINGEAQLLCVYLTRSFYLTLGFPLIEGTEKMYESKINIVLKLKYR